MCSICCELNRTVGENGGLCMGAELAARELVAIGTKLPENWPDEDYRGPNVSIRLCKNEQCKIAELRAWAPGSACVTRNAVGVCAPRGVCKQSYLTPRSNIYPDIMRVKFLDQRRKSSTCWRPSTMHCLLPFALTMIVK
ncbi:uncharacterized protein LOC135082644 [Ostrinia nubilalis]|uniref:uncharacterized protein LOC135082644 n=1 Tax=Ostrinia nubilalis TaxID=29057 RepID=UPI00308242AA